MLSTTTPGETGPEGSAVSALVSATTKGANSRSCMALFVIVTEASVKVTDTVSEE